MVINVSEPGGIPYAVDSNATSPSAAVSYVFQEEPPWKMSAAASLLCLLMCGVSIIGGLVGKERVLQLWQGRL